MIHDPVSVEGLQRAILVWETMQECYKMNMKEIRRQYRLTWFLRRAYWRNEKRYINGFQGLIKRRTQLQTAIKEKESSK